MPTESVEIVIGAKNQTRPAFDQVKKDSKHVEVSLGDVADTSARTTAALALMTQVMGDTPFGALIGDLGILKGSLDAVRAATASNASALEKMIAKVSLYASVANIGFKGAKFITGYEEAIKKLNDELERSENIRKQMILRMTKDFSNEQFTLGLVDSFDGKKDFIQQKIDQWTQEKASLEGLIEDTNKKIVDWKKDLTKVKAWDLFGANQVYSDIEASEDLLKDYTDKLAKATSIVQSYQTQQNRLVEANERKIQKDKEEAEAIRQKQIAMEKEIAIAKQAAAIKAAAAQAEEERKQRLEDARILGQEHLKTLREQLRTLQFGADAAERMRLAENGVKNEVLLAGEEYKRQIRFLNERNKLEAQAQMIIARNMTPLEQFRKEYQKLAETYKAGFIGDGTFKSELERLKKTLVQQSIGPVEKLQPLQPLQQESSRFLARARGVDVAQQTAANTKKSNDILARAEIIFNKINENLIRIEQKTKQPKVIG